MGRERKERERRKILSTIPLFFPCGCGEKTEKRKKKKIRRVRGAYMIRI